MRGGNGKRGAARSASTRSARDAALDCTACEHFVDDPRQLERLFPGIGALSSTQGSCRGRAGVCAVDDTFRDPATGCPHFQPRRKGTP